MKRYSDGRVVGGVYEEDGRFYYDCEHCSQSYSGPDEHKIEDYGDHHTQQQHPRE